MLHKNVECYVDNLMVKSKQGVGHITNLRYVFERLRRYQLKMNPLKCLLRSYQVNFWGLLYDIVALKLISQK